MNGIWTDLSSFFFLGCCSLAETLENFSGHVPLVPAPLFTVSHSPLMPPSLILSQSPSMYICTCTYSILNTSRGLVCPFYPLLSLPFFLPLLFHSPVLSSTAVYHCCLAGLSVNPGLVQKPCLLSPSASLSLSQPAEKFPSL